MHRSFSTFGKTRTLLLGALLLGTALGAQPLLRLAHADQSSAAGASQHASEVKEPAPDPKRKKAGEPCKNSDECQRHHSCAKVGDKNVCQAPPRHELPPGAVT